VLLKSDTEILTVLDTAISLVMKLWLIEVKQKSFILIQLLTILYNLWGTPKMNNDPTTKSIINDSKRDMISLEHSSVC
jgi:hypothetical protein